MIHELPERHDEDAIMLRRGPADDNLPSFREAFPTPDDIDEDGARMLAAAIIAQTAEDYFDHCNDEDRPYELASNQTVDDIPNNQLCTRHMQEAFIDGPVFECLTDIDPQFFKEGIREYKKHHKKLPNTSSMIFPDYDLDNHRSYVRSKHKGKGIHVTAKMGNFI